MSESNNDWFFVDNAGQQNGPHSRDELIARWRAGELAGTSLVWAPSLPEWAAFAHAFPELTPPVTPPAPLRPPPTPAVTGGLDKISGSLSPMPGPALPSAWTDSAPAAAAPLGMHSDARISPGVHPWRRYFAKQMDLMIFAFGAVFAIAVLLELANPEAAAGFYTSLDSPIMGYLIVVGLWAMGDALCLALFGNTPGRALFGMQIRMLDGSRISGETAAKRTGLVAIKGLGFGIPIVAFITNLVAYEKLTKKGITSWDSDLGTRVTHRQWSAARAVVVVLTTIAATFALMVLIAMGE